MLLFANAGTLRYTGITNVLASKLLGGVHEQYLLPTILWTSVIGSSILDNVVLVAAYIPVIFSLKDIGVDISNLWWALLLGGCLGGNITMVGSTANIIALGMLEEKENYFMPFLKWFGVGLTMGVVLVFEGVVAAVMVGVFSFLVMRYFSGWQTALAVGVVFGAICSATDPASTISVLWEYKARGTLTINPE